MAGISAREANQRFARLLARAEAGEEVVITKRGRPVARLVPATGGAGLRPASVPQATDIDEARHHLARVLQEGIPFGGRGVRREAMHRQ